MNIEQAVETYVSSITDEQTVIRVCIYIKRLSDVELPILGGNHPRIVRIHTIPRWAHAASDGVKAAVNKL